MQGFFSKKRRKKTADFLQNQRFFDGIWVVMWFTKQAFRAGFLYLVRKAIVLSRYCA